MERLGVLGPQGTHSEAAAHYLCRAASLDAELAEYAEIYDVLQAVREGRADACLVPVENSLEGAVNITLDVLARSDDLAVARELIWPVHNQLMGKCRPEEVRRIYSHPQPISQCRAYLQAHYPQAEVVKVSSTARAAQIVGEAPAASGFAAICARRGGELNGLHALAAEVQDNMANCTRFFEVRRRGSFPPSADAAKAFVICQIDGSKAGSLCEVLEEFARRGINMTRIESRPARTKLGAYIFFFDLERGGEDGLLQEAIAAVRQKSFWLRHLGTFPVLDAATGD